MADNNSKQKWNDCTSEILKSLDIPAEYRALGVDVCGHKPSAQGWIECRSFGVEDRTPSAGINVAPGPLQGRYKSFRDGETLGLFDFAATKAGRFGGDWREARKHYARTAGVELPNGDEELVADRFEFTDLSAGTMLNYAAAKPGVSWQAIKDVGGQYARWPKKLSAEKTNHLIAFPMYGAALLDLEPTGWHSVSANPRFKIRKFQGHGHEEQLLDKMTAGEYGLMNVDGLKRLAEADVVNIVEGITDLLAGQAVLIDWRAADPDGRKHVILSAGGCTYHPKAEWMPHFAGKEVRLWFDVGDAKDEGQMGAGVWAKALLPVTDKVRNVKLPLGPEESKNDLRAWLAGFNGNTAHNYADMDELARSFPFVEATDEAAQVSPGDAILAKLGLTIIGEYEGRQMVEVFSDVKKKSGTIMDVDKITIPKLVQLLGSEAVGQCVYDGRDECPPDKYELKQVKHAIADAASDKTFYGDEKFGAGIWEHDGQLVLVKSKEIGLLNAQGRIERSHVPFAAGRLLDCGRGSGDWYDLDVLNRHLASAGDHEWCGKVIEESYEIFSRWNWRQAQHAPTMIVGLVICSWMQSVWRWRPQVFVTGNSSTGKTILLQEVVSGGIFGPPGGAGLGMFVEKPTEAAISQFMKHHSKVIFIDEFEKDAQRQKILELFRTTSRGGVKIRGTADHRGIQFKLRHIPWLSSIETGLTREADKNRYIILDLDVITDEKRTGFKVPSFTYLQDLGMKLLAIGIGHYREARKLAAILEGQDVPNVPGRCVESFALPIAMLSTALGYTVEQAIGFLRGILMEWDFAFQSSPDHIDCLFTIMTQEVRMRGGESHNVSTLLSTMGPDAKDALGRVGVKKVSKHNHHDVLWLCPDVVARQLLKNTKYDNHAVDQYLMRFAGASRNRQRMGGNERFNGIEIPYDLVDKIFDSADTQQEALAGSIE